MMPQTNFPNQNLQKIDRPPHSEYTPNYQNQPSLSNDLEGNKSLRIPSFLQTPIKLYPLGIKLYISIYSI